VTRLRVAVLADYREEGWPSMDRVADQLLAALDRLPAERGVAATAVCPRFVRRATALSSGPVAVNVDRGLNRFVDYPRRARAIANDFDVFHVVDHSYAQLVHHLPANRTVVTCHDLDTFRSVLDPAGEPRGLPFRLMSRHILSGLGRAAAVACDARSVRDQIVGRQILPAERVVVAPLGVSEAFVPETDSQADREAAGLVGAPADAIQILHVGSVAPRKRLDVLLRCCGGLRREGRDVHLVRVGGPFTREQERLLGEEGLQGHVSVLPPIDDRVLAAVYRRAALVLVPSEREGFGLPVVEALRCGTPVVASDLSVLREVGEVGVEFCAVGHVTAWKEVVGRLLSERAEQPDRWAARRARGLLGVTGFSWSRYAASMAAIYQAVAGNRPIAPSMAQAVRTA
jgi:glycosyltransferase involved in cell wall biosynthesis